MTAMTSILVCALNVLLQTQPQPAQHQTQPAPTQPALTARPALPSEGSPAAPGAAQAPASCPAVVVKKAEKKSRRSWVSVEINPIFATSSFFYDYQYMGGGLELALRVNVAQRVSVTLSAGYLGMRSSTNEDNYIETGNQRPVHNTVLLKTGVSFYSKIGGKLRIRHEFSFGGWWQPGGGHTWDHFPFEIFHDPLIFEIRASSRLRIVVNPFSLGVAMGYLPSSIMSRVGIKFDF